MTPHNAVIFIAFLWWCALAITFCANAVGALFLAEAAYTARTAPSAYYTGPQRPASRFPAGAKAWDQR